MYSGEENTKNIHSPECHSFIIFLMSCDFWHLSLLRVKYEKKLWYSECDKDNNKMQAGYKGLEL